MARILLLVLSLLVLAASAPAKDRRRSRRNPRSAQPPPIDYEGIRKKVDGAVRPRLARWLEARTRVKDPDTDAATVENFHMSPFSHRRWAEAEDDPAALDGIVISAFEIGEIRVLGRHHACALVKVRTVADPEGPWHPEVSYWFAMGNDWKVRAPWSKTIPPDSWGAGPFPAGGQAQPRQETGAVEALETARRVLYPPISGRSRETKFVVRCRAPGVLRESVFNVKGWVRGRFELKEKLLPLREGKCGDVDAQQRLIESLLTDLMSRLGILIDLREYHLKVAEGGILAEGFAPERYLERVAISLDGQGRPKSIVRTLAGSAQITRPRYMTRGSWHLIAGWDRVTDGVKETLEIRWRKQRPDWWPEHMELTRPEGTYEITVTSW